MYQFTLLRECFHKSYGWKKDVHEHFGSAHTGTRFLATFEFLFKINCKKMYCHLWICIFTLVCTTVLCVSFSVTFLSKYFSTPFNLNNKWETNLHKTQYIRLWNVHTSFLWHMRMCFQNEYCICMQGAYGMMWVVCIL